MIDVFLKKGPIGQELGWIAQLYGAHDPKYRNPRYLDNQFNRNPFGWSLHAFAMDEEQAIGHCAVIPVPARLGATAVVSGKAEAFAISERYQSAAIGELPLAMQLLRNLYGFADRHGIRAIHVMSDRIVGGLHGMAGCRRVALSGEAYTFIANGQSFRELPRAAWKTAASQAVGTVQHALFETLNAGARAAGWTNGVAVASPPGPLAWDAEPEACLSLNDGWTILGRDAWDWYVGSGVLQVLAIPGSRGGDVLLKGSSRAGRGGGECEIIGWRPAGKGLASAMALLGAVLHRVAQSDAAALVVRPWLLGPHEMPLRRACRLLGGVPRARGMELYVRSKDKEFHDRGRVLFSPFFYATY